jgi:hypothetical protein
MQDLGIQALERELERLTKDFENQKQSLLDTIAMRRQTLLSGSCELPPTRKVVRGEYAGMDLKAAMHAYLAARGGTPIPRERMAADLATAGANLGHPSRHVRNLKIVSSNNKGVFRYDEATDAIGLVESGHGPPARRARGAD